MRNWHMLLCTFILLACNRQKEEVISSPQPGRSATPVTTVPAKHQEPGTVSFVRSKVTNINTSKLEPRHFEFTCDEPMKVDYFYRNDSIVKISVDFGTIGDTYAREDYYYDRGELIFMYEFVEGGPACEGCITKHEYRYYIHDHKTFKSLKDQQEQPCRKCEFPPSSRQYELLDANTTEEIKSIICR